MTVTATAAAHADGTDSVDITDDDGSNASLSGFVYHDANQNGFRDAGEPGIPGVFIDLAGTTAQAETINRRALTADDGSYAFVELSAGSYTISETQPPAFVDGEDSIGTQGGTTTNDIFEIIDLLANDTGRNNNFGENALTPGQFSRRFFLASSVKAKLYRDSNANLTELAGNPEDADLIRNSGIPSVVNGDDAFVQVNRVPVIDAIPDQQANVGEELRVPVTASDPDNNQLQFELDEDRSPATAEISATNDGAEIRWTPNAEDAQGTVIFRVIVTDDGQPQRSDTAEFAVIVSDPANPSMTGAEGEQASSQSPHMPLDETEDSSADAKHADDVDRDPIAGDMLSEADTLGGSGLPA